MAFDPTKIGPNFRYVDANKTLVAGSDIIVANFNPYRVAIYFQAFTGGAILRPIIAAANTVGINLPASGVMIQFQMDSSGPLCQQEWHAFGSAGGNVYVLEVLWNPPGG